MALAYAILTLLVEHPHSGYDITKKFDGSVGFFWKATHQQIYRELAKLETQNWVHSEVIPQAGRPDKRLYALTDLGKQQLLAWLAEATEPMTIKEELLIKLSVGYLASPEQMVQELERHRQIHLDKLAIYRQLEQKHFQNLSAVSEPLKYSYLTLRRGIHYETDYVAWCDEAIALLNQWHDEQEHDRNYSAPAREM
jgi:DNA-binding PadR family transcriptional regulator